MSRAGTNHRDRNAAGSAATTEGEASRPRGRAEGQAEGDATGSRAGTSHAELVEQLRHNAVQLLAGVPRPPRSLRIRAGDVSVDVEWADEPVATVDRPGDHLAPGHAGVVGPTAGPGSEATGVAVAAVAAAIPAGADAGQARHYLTAPTVGTFYRAPQPGAPPFVAEGDTVTVRQQVGIVEAMKVMIPVEADAGGRVVEVLKADGESVEYGDRLFALAVETGGEPS